MEDKSTGYALFSIRLTLFILMIMWAFLKVALPGSYAGGGDAPGIFEKFYGVAIGGQVVLIIGIAQILLLLAFLAGLFKFITTGAVMLMNLASMIVSSPNFTIHIAEQPNILFLTAVPVFGASLALFLMRKKDTFLSFGK